jgi:hypothetical protein
MAEAHLAVVSCEPDRVVVAATGRVAHVFGRALPGTPDTADVDATAAAAPVVGGE